MPEIIRVSREIRIWAANSSGTILKLIALARREPNAPSPERRSALEKAEGLRRATKACWERLGVDPVLVERMRTELAGGSALVGAQTEAAEAATELRFGP